MSGHSHASNVRKKKEKSAQQRSIAFTKASKQIMVAVREGGANPEANSALRIAIDFAKSVNMPKDNIERVIKKASGEYVKGDLKQVIYEAYGPEMFPMLIEVVTDNINRTLGDLRNILSNAGGRLADKGSVAWQFKEVGLIRMKPSKNDQNMDIDECTLEVLELGDINDVIFVNGECFVIVDKQNTSLLLPKIEKLGYKVNYAGRFYMSTEQVRVTNELKNKIEEVIADLEELNEIQNIWSPLDLLDI